MAVWLYTNLELPVKDLLTMWASPNNIPINISLTSSGNTIEALWLEDNRGIPFVVRAAKSIWPDKKNNNIRIKSINIMLIHSIYTMVGLYLQLKKLSRA